MGTDLLRLSLINQAFLNVSVYIENDLSTFSENLLLQSSQISFFVWWEPAQVELNICSFIDAGSEQGQYKHDFNWNDFSGKGNFSGG